MRLEGCLSAALVATALLDLCTARAAEGDWLNFGNNAGGTRYSPLTQIMRGRRIPLRPVP
jgi:glucose dehydrogenase